MRLLGWDIASDTLEADEFHHSHVQSFHYNSPTAMCRRMAHV